MTFIRLSIACLNFCFSSYVTITSAFHSFMSLFTFSRILHAFRPISTKNFPGTPPRSYCSLLPPLSGSYYTSTVSTPPCLIPDMHKGLKWMQPFHNFLFFPLQPFVSAGQLLCHIRSVALRSHHTHPRCCLKLFETFQSYHHTMNLRWRPSIDWYIS